MRPRAGGDPVIYATKTALRALGRRVLALDAETDQIDRLLTQLLNAGHEDLLSLYGVGIDQPPPCWSPPATIPHRLRSEASWARLCGVAPIHASSGKLVRLRLNPGGDRQANAALWHIVITRMSSDLRTRSYVERRTKEGRSKKEIIRVLKRYVAREVYHYLRPI